MFLPLSLSAMRTQEECAVLAWTHLASRLVSTFSRLHNSLPSQHWCKVVGPDTHTHTLVHKHERMHAAIQVHAGSSSAMIYYLVVKLPLRVFPPLEYFSNVKNVNVSLMCARSHADFSMMPCVAEKLHEWATVTFTSLVSVVASVKTTIMIQRANKKYPGKIRIQLLAKCKHT